MEQYLEKLDKILKQPTLVHYHGEADVIKFTVSTYLNDLTEKIIEDIPNDIELIDEVGVSTKIENGNVALKQSLRDKYLSN